MWHVGYSGASGRSRARPQYPTKEITTWLF